MFEDHGYEPQEPWKGFGEVSNTNPTPVWLCCGMPRFMKELENN